MSGTQLSQNFNFDIIRKILNFTLHMPQRNFFIRLWILYINTYKYTHTYQKQIIYLFIFRFL